jgi:hypothetical protein
VRVPVDFRCLTAFCRFVGTSSLFLVTWPVSSLRAKVFSTPPSYYWTGSVTDFVSLVMIYSDERSSSIIGLMSRRRRKSGVAELLFLFLPFKAVK